MPVFIVGFARSGTTLCQRLVAEHLGMATMPETHFFERLDRYDPQDGWLEPSAARGLLAELGDYLDIDVTQHESLLAAEQVSVLALFLSLVAEQIGSAELAERGRWLEKTPRHVLHLERILSLFPGAKFICMQRNPLTAFASRRQLNEPGKGWGEPWRPVEDFCVEWQQTVHHALAFGAAHPGQLLWVLLEALSSAPERELERIAAFLGDQPAGPGARAPDSAKIVQPFETWKLNALGPVNPSLALRSGETGLDAYDRWRVQSLLAKELQTFGYLDQSVKAPPMDALHQKLLDAIDWYRALLARR